MSTKELISCLREAGIKLYLDNGELRFQAPKGALTPELREKLVENKCEVIAFLRKVSLDSSTVRQPILPVPRDGEHLPVSFSQQSLWFFDQWSPKNPVYNIPNAVRLYGELNINAMETAISTLVKRHESLRTTFKGIDGKPVQVIVPESEYTLEVKDLSYLQAKDAEIALERELNEVAWTAFDLEKGPVWRTQLFKINEMEYVFFLVIHHIISDAWSNIIFVKEFLSLYEAFNKGITPNLPVMPVQFADYACWQRKLMADQEVRKNLLDYWKEKLASPVVLELPTDYPRPVAQSFSGSTATLNLSKDLSTRLKELCIKEDVTLFMLLLAVFEILLYRYSGQEDIIIGTVAANRGQIESTGLIGFVMNTLALRCNLMGNPTVKELLKRVKQTTLCAYDYQELPFDMLLEELKLERDISRTPLFQVMYIHQNVQEVELKANGLKIEIEEVENSAAPFDLRLTSKETEEGIEARLDYCTDLFKPDTIERMLAHFTNLLEAVAKDTSLKIGQMPLLSKEEYRQLVMEFNQTTVPYPTNKLIHELFEQQVEKSPDTIAVVFGLDQLTYSELNCRANQLASYLRKMGVGPDMPVGVCLERSLDMVVSLLGILKAGGAYVPFDPGYPKARFEHMIQDAKVKLILTWEKFIEKIPSSEAVVLCLDKEKKVLEMEDVKNPVVNVNDKNLAYVIYTSGSTGKPKGAMNTHLGMRNHKQWMQDTFKLTGEDAVLQKTPFSFDVSVWEFFWPLITGARLVVAQPEGHKDSSYIVKTIIEQKISVIHFVPSMLSAFLEHPDVEKCTGLKQVFVSGEALSPQLERRFHDLFLIPLHNVYGPAECADVSTSWTCTGDSKDKTMPIGRPISNVQVYILDSFMNPVPVGVPGELCVSGAGVGRGYINNPELTGERFVNITLKHDEFGEKNLLVYKTGDRAFWRPDGVVEYIGRADFQVKIRGLRIELGEIEEVILKHGLIKEAVVVAQESENGNKYLCAYIVQHSEIDEHDLKEYLSESLPEYMVPSYFVNMEQIPLLPNGKVDRKALPKPDRNEGNKGKYEPPRNATEEKLTELWKRVLEIDKIGIHDNFFELGGHSLLATIMVSEIVKQFKKSIPLQNLFLNPTIAGISKLLYDEEDEECSEQYVEGEL
ncbi:non-ribosomal peptide synthetase [Acetivibrio cellulolyticus]|uniref:non-ribosomal peptide synthetase n=1 Tax=Acetivibrio cellulolyticus TaxID=35830 RepID=UPI0001E2DEB9|nr:non-ribosomal peptide synthetase [Acetivibrio cellulolyticus]